MGLRCPYHGWLYDSSGQCIEMPAEPGDSTFPSRVKLAAYPVQELAGLVFAYLGPEPAPLLPKWDLFVEDNVLRDVGMQVVNCNWLQMQENDLDPGHAGWLHSYFSNYVLERLGHPELRREAVDLGASYRGRSYLDRVPDRYDFQPFEHGVMNLVRQNGELRQHRPTLFPNMNSFQTLFMYRVPMDDTHTLHITYNTYALPEGETARQESIPYYMIPPSIDDAGRPIWDELDNNGGQDIAAWAAQGEIVDRSIEKLGESDRGIIIFREMLRRQLRVVEDGGEPLNVFRDPQTNQRINVPPRDGSRFEWPGRDGGFMRRVNASWTHSPVVTELIKKYRGEDALQRPVH